MVGVGGGEVGGVNPFHQICLFLCLEPLLV